MRLERRTLAGDPAALVAELRGLVPGAADVADAVMRIVLDVRHGGDEALERYRRELDAGGADPGPLCVPREEIDAALAGLDPAVRAALKRAAANVRAVAQAGVDEERSVELPEGQTVVLRELPVARAAVYVPGGRAPYPSTVIMGAVTARAAGVREVVVCTPSADPLVLAACALAGVEEVYRMGGAHAIAALAHGTPTIPRVDVIVGPGNLYVQEAKLVVRGEVGIDGFAGPSDLLVVIDDARAAALAALDLRAQAEHGADSLVVAVSPEQAVLDALAAQLADVPEAGAAVLVRTDDLDGALALAEAFAPEHLQLIGPGAEALAPRVTRAGCLFVGAGAATAFGDYLAGSNHVLPTDGAARYASGLSARTFRRRMAEVHIAPAAAARLATDGVALARAEGFTAHAESMEARIRENAAR
ncbi:MAG: histidinol dehydrogenase [Actinobacteria bacterium]|nr:histidinol dehydrogenase [Actinomycetota bacterium]